MTLAFITKFIKMIHTPDVINSFFTYDTPNEKSLIPILSQQITYHENESILACNIITTVVTRVAFITLPIHLFNPLPAYITVK